MKETPTVTVITSFLDAERFIEEAVESVFSQTYSEWELLLVDDGSTDRSSAIALRYAKKYPDKVRYIEHDGHVNRGISASQNRGIREARGRYIAFLDADDVWLDAKLEQQVAILDSQPEAMMLCGQTLYWYGWIGNAQEAGKDLLIEPVLQLEGLIRPPSLLVSFLREEAPIPCPSDIIVRRDAAVDVGGFEEKFRRIFTDQAFYAKFCLKWPVFVANQNWSKYRKHPDSAVSVVKKAGRLRSSRILYLNWLANYLDQSQIDDKSLRDAIRIASWRCRYPGLFRLRAHLKYRGLTAKEFLKSVARRTIPFPVNRWLRAQRENRVRQSR